MSLRGGCVIMGGVVKRRADLLAAAGVAGLLLAAGSPARGEVPPSSATEDEDPSPPSAPPLEARWVHRPRTGLLIAGAVTFGVSYGAALWFGLTVSTNVDTDPCNHCLQRAGLVVVPLAGPALYAWKTPGSSTWPFAVWTGVEAVGAAMLVVGAVGRDVLQFERHRAGVTLVPAFTREARALSLSVRW